MILAQSAKCNAPLSKNAASQSLPEGRLNPWRLLAIVATSSFQVADQVAIYPPGRVLESHQLLGACEGLHGRGNITSQRFPQI